MTAATPADPAALKRALRAEFRTRLAALAPGDRALGSAAIRARLLALPEWRDAVGILGFAALETEPDIGPALAAAADAGATVALPRWDERHGEYRPAALPPGRAFVPGPFGVLEPPPEAPLVPWERLDLVLVPGLAFDRRGRRLGRGRGFFDRILARAGNARRCGVAFDLQVAAEVPSEPHDINVHLLVTPGLCLSFDRPPSGTKPTGAGS